MVDERLWKVTCRYLCSSRLPRANTPTWHSACTCRVVSVCVACTNPAAHPRHDSWKFNKLSTCNGAWIVVSYLQNATVAQALLRTASDARSTPHASTSCMSEQHAKYLLFSLPVYFPPTSLLARSAGDKLGTSLTRASWLSSPVPQRGLLVKLGNRKKAEFESQPFLLIWLRVHDCSLAGSTGAGKSN